MAKWTTRGLRCVQDFSRCVCILFPLLRLIIPEKPANFHVKQCIFWIAEFSRNVLSECFVIPLLNCFALHVGGQHNFGRVLTSTVVLYLFWLVALLYCCLIPRRIFISNMCSKFTDSECDPSVEVIWFIVHLICSHWSLALIFFHYFSAIFLHAGTVPTVLYPEMSPYFSMCVRCAYPRPSRAHHCSVCGQCVLLMDHHCPWIANCVGLHTHRHFYLSLVYMSFGGIYMLTVGRSDFLAHLRETEHSVFPQTHNRSAVEPRIVWVHANRLSVVRLMHAFSVICFRIGLIAIPLVIALCCWQTYLITRGETNVEYHINQRLAKKQQQRGLIYRNPYDLGPFINWIKLLGLCNPNEFETNGFRISRSMLLWRVFTRVILPSPTVLCENGLKFKVNTPTVESTTAALRSSDQMH